MEGAIAGPTVTPSAFMIEAGVPTHDAVATSNGEAEAEEVPSEAAEGLHTSVAVSPDEAAQCKRVRAGGADSAHDNGSDADHVNDVVTHAQDAHRVNHLDVHADMEQEQTEQPQVAHFEHAHVIDVTVPSFAGDEWVQDAPHVHADGLQQAQTQAIQHVECVDQGADAPVDMQVDAGVQTEEVPPQLVHTTAAAPLAFSLEAIGNAPPTTAPDAPAEALPVATEPPREPCTLDAAAMVRAHAYTMAYDEIRRREAAQLAASHVYTHTFTKVTLDQRCARIARILGVRFNAEGDDT